jgi:hypothetical protein
MKAEREDYDPVYYEIATYAAPARSRFNHNNQVPSRKKRARAHTLYDGHAIGAFNILSGGMTSGLSSPSRPWFRFALPDPDLMKFWPVKVWLADVERIIYDFLGKTNFYTAVKSGYSELGLFGTEAMFMDEHWNSGIVFSTMTAGEYYLACGDDQRVDTLCHHVPMTVRQIVQRFVADRFDSHTMHWDRVSRTVKQLWDNSNDDTTVQVMRLVEPNPAYDSFRGDADGKRFRSLWWECGNDNKTAILSKSGYEEQAFVGARWQTIGNDTYGSGPGWNALPDMRVLQVQAKRLGELTDLLAKPPVVAPVGTRVKLTPGAVTYAAQVDMAGVKPLFQVDGQAIDRVEQTMARLYGKIDTAAFADIFMAITQMDGVQPRNQEEIFARNEEKLTQLGPVVERVSTEKLKVILDRVFYVLERRGAFPEPPEELDGIKLSIEFISTLAQAQRMIGLSQVERVVGFVGNLAESFPEAADNLDPDALVHEYADRAGSPPKIMRDPAAVDELRQQRQASEAEAKAAAMMPAVKQAADGAQLLSETPINTGEPNLLDTLMAGTA